MEVEKCDTDNKSRTKVYDEINVFGKYQSRLCLMLLLSTIPNSFTTFQFLAIHYTPQFRCNVINGTYYGPANDYNNSNSVNSRLMNTCNFDNITGLTLVNETNAYNNTEQHHEDMSTNMVCTDWTFMGNETSAVTEFGMICNNKWQKPFSVSMYMFGKLVGGVMGGLISDKFGRKPTFLVFSAWQYLTTFVTSFSPNMSSYSAMMFLTGCGGLVNYVAAVLLGTEVVAPKKRSMVYVYISVGYSIGCMLIAPLAFFILNWRWFLRTIGFVGLLYIPYIWLLDESPLWLLAVGKNDEAKKVLNKIAKCNKVQSSVSKDESSEMLVETDDSIGLWPTCKLIARTPTLLKRLAIVGLSWFTCSGSYYTISLDIGSLSGNRFLNILLLGVAEFVATGLFFVAWKRWGNRNSYLIFMSASAVVFAIRPLLKMSSIAALQVAVVIVGRLFITTSFCVIFVYTGELFPTAVRNICMGFSSGMSRFGSMLAPFIIYAGHQTNSIAVPLCIAVFVLLTSSLYIFLPKTEKTQLPQTVQEALEMKSGGLSCHLKKQKTKTSKENFPDP